MKGSISYRIMKQFQHNPSATSHISDLEKPQLSEFGQAKSSLYLKYLLYKLQANISFLLRVHNASFKVHEANGQSKVDYRQLEEIEHGTEPSGPRPYTC